MHKHENVLVSKNGKNFERLRDSGAIIFNRDGTEAFMMTSSMELNTQDLPLTASPREIHDVTFLEHEIGSSSNRISNIKLQTTSSVKDWPIECNERINSPSMASMASGYSLASSMASAGGRRNNLEWDSGADLGYVDAELHQPQSQAAASLSALEKMTIENYSAYLKEHEIMSGGNRRYSSSSQFQLMNSETDRRNAVDQDELRRVRLNRFADFFLTQQATKLRQAMLPLPPQSLSVNSKPETATVRHISRPDLQSDASAASSSTCTVIGTCVVETENPSSSHKRSYSMPESINMVSTPVHENIFKITQGIKEISCCPLPQFVDEDAKSTIKGSGKGSVLEGSQSCEAVIEQSKNCIDQDLEESTPLISTFRSNSIPPNATATLDTISSDASSIEIQFYRKSRKTEKMCKFRKSLTSLVSSEDNVVSTSASLAFSSVSPLRFEVNEKLNTGFSLPVCSTGTLESTMIDRTKSFEYFPGESYPLQENSTSYEYLPGHLVNEDRPETVVHNHQQSNLASVSGFPSEIDLSQSTTPNVMSCRDGDDEIFQETSEESIITPESNIKTFQINKLTNELRHRAKELLEDNLKHTRLFYKHLKKYINYASSPSSTLEEVRLKQDLVDRILHILDKQKRKMNKGTNKIMAVALHQTSSPNGKSCQFKPQSNLVSDSSSLFSENPPKRNSVRRNSADYRRKKYPNSMKEQRFLQKPLPRTDHVIDVDRNKSCRDIISINERLAVILRKQRESQLGRIQHELDYLKELDQAVVQQEVQLKPSLLSGGISTFVSNLNTFVNEEYTLYQKRHVSIPPDVSYYNRNKTGFIDQETELPATDDSSSIVSKYVKQRKKASSNPTESAVDITDPIVSSNSDVVVAKSSGKTRVKDSGYVNDKSLNRKSALSRAYFYSFEPDDSIIRNRIRGKENRERVASATAAITTDIPQRSRGFSSSASSLPVKSNFDGLSLQEALARGNPKFVRRSTYRQNVLNTLREERLKNASSYRHWIENIATCPSATETSVIQPPPEPTRNARHLFTHKQMTQMSRKKCENLPERRKARIEARKHNDMLTNVLRHKLYNQQLKTDVLQGKVSRGHHNPTVN